MIGLICFIVGIVFTIISIFLWCCLAVAKESDERIKGESNE